MKKATAHSMEWPPTRGIVPCCVPVIAFDSKEERDAALLSLTAMRALQTHRPVEIDIDGLGHVRCDIMVKDRWEAGEAEDIVEATLKAIEGVND